MSTNSHRERKGGAHDAWQLSEANLLWGVVVLLALGMALAVIALLLATHHPSTVVRVASAIAGALAGGLIGTSVTILVHRRLDYSPLTQVRVLLEQTIESSMTSAEDDVGPVRTTWHHYYQSLIDRQVIWRYHVMTFGQAVGIGSLSTQSAISDPQGVPHVYRVEGAVRGPRLILTLLPLHGRESAAVEIFPHFLYEFRTLHAGVGLMQTWDGGEIVGRCLLSQAPVIPTDDTLVPREHLAQLDASWRKAFSGVRNALDDTDVTASDATAG